MDKIAILIPCYNEAKTVQKVVQDWKNALPEATIYVYDNNSTDGTDELARSAGAIVRYEPMQGKEMLFAECSGKSTQNAILWLMEMTLTPPNMDVIWLTLY